jgi:hypothetical protein
MSRLESVLTRANLRGAPLTIGDGSVRELSREELFGALAVADKGPNGWGVELLAGLIMADQVLTASAKGRFARFCAEICAERAWISDRGKFGNSEKSHPAGLAMTALALASTVIEEVATTTGRRPCHCCRGTGQVRAEVCPVCLGARSITPPPWGAARRWALLRERCNLTRAEYLSLWDLRYCELMQLVHEALGEAEGQIVRAAG